MTGNISKESLQSLVGCSMDAEEFRTFIDDMATESGVSQVETDYFLEFKESGLCINFSESLKVDSIFLYSGDSAGYQPYKGELPFGLEFSFGLLDVRAVLGNPFRSGGGGHDLLRRIIPSWDLYPWGQCFVNLQYDGSESQITLVTIMHHEVLVPQ